MPDASAPNLNALAATGSLADVGPYLPPGTPRGWTYRRHRLHQTAYPKLQHPGYRIPPPYGGVFKIYSDLRTIWTTLDPPTRRLWYRLAKPRRLTPYMQFVRTNTARLKQNLPPITEP
jgi:hypothetical protein